MIAGFFGHVDLIKILLPVEAKMQNTNGKTALIIAVEQYAKVKEKQSVNKANKLLEAIKLLATQDCGRSVYKIRSSALMSAVKYNLVELIPLLKGDHRL